MNLGDYHLLFLDERRSWDLTQFEGDVRIEDPGFPEKIGELLPREGERLSGDLIDLDTGALYQRLQQLCELYRAGTHEQRSYVRSRIEVHAAGQMVSFGLTSSVAGARSRLLLPIQLSLAAFGIADLTGGDVRDVLIPLAVVFDCTGKAGGDPPVEFRNGAELCRPGMAAVLRDYADRKPADQSLASMGWREVSTPHGVGYRHGF